MDWDVKDDLVLRGKGHESTDQLEVEWRLETLTIEVVEPVVWVVHEHAPHWIEQFFEQQLEEFLLDSSLVNSWLTCEDDSEWLLLDLLADAFLGQTVQTIFQYVVSSYLDGEVCCSKDVVYGCRIGCVRIEQAAKILQESVSNVLVSLVLLDDPEQLCFPVSI